MRRWQAFSADATLMPLLRCFDATFHAMFHAFSVVDYDIFSHFEAFIFRFAAAAAETTCHYAPPRIFHYALY